MEDLIKISVEDRDGTVRELEVPMGISLSLMEILKASEYDILATCGGMALCATCHVQVKSGMENLPAAEDHELDMLDTLPDAETDSRLACQIRLGSHNEGLAVRIRGVMG